MQINLVYESSVSNAPDGFKTALAYAAAQLDSMITNPIIVNIEVGWGDVGGAAMAANGLADGGQSNGMWMTYSNVMAELAANASNAADKEELASLPASPPSNIPNYFITSAQEKA